MKTVCHKITPLNYLNGKLYPPSGLIKKLGDYIMKMGNVIFNILLFGWGFIVWGSITDQTLHMGYSLPSAAACGLVGPVFLAYPLRGKFSLETMRNLFVITFSFFIIMHIIMLAIRWDTLINGI
jgi:hypothetical protein